MESYGEAIPLDRPSGSIFFADYGNTSGVDAFISIFRPMNNCLHLSLSTDEVDHVILPDMPGATGIFHIFKFPVQDSYEFNFEFEDSNDAGKANVYFIKGEEMNLDQ